MDSASARRARPGRDTRESDRLRENSRGSGRGDEALDSTIRPWREERREVVIRQNRSERLFERARVTDIVVDFHPHQGLVATSQQAAHHARALLDRAEHAAYRSARGRCLFRGDTIVDVVADRRCCTHAIRPRGAAVSVSAYGSGSIVSAGPSREPTRTSPASRATSCSTASRSAPPPGAEAALTTLPHAWSPKLRPKRRSPAAGGGASTCASASRSL